MYKEGKGLPQDEKEAHRLYGLAADQGAADAQRALGGMYVEGKCLPLDYEEAARLYRLAADQGDTGAQCVLAGMYREGKGVSQDDEESARLYQLVAEQDDASELCCLGFAYLYGLSGVPQDDKEAHRFYRLAADQGDPDAQCSLGGMYMEGKGVPQDYDEAPRLYQLAADQGNTDAECVLGGEGKDVPKAFMEYLKLVELAAAKGNTSREEGSENPYTELTAAKGNASREEGSENPYTRELHLRVPLTIAGVDLGGAAISSVTIKRTDDSASNVESVVQMIERRIFGEATEDSCCCFPGKYRSELMLESEGGEMSKLESKDLNVWAAGLGGDLWKKLRFVRARTWVGTLLRCAPKRDVADNHTGAVRGRQAEGQPGQAQPPVVMASFSFV